MGFAPIAQFKTKEEAEAYKRGISAVAKCKKRTDVEVNQIRGNRWKTIVKDKERIVFKYTFNGYQETAAFLIGVRDGKKHNIQPEEIHIFDETKTGDGWTVNIE